MLFLIILGSKDLLANLHPKFELRVYCGEIDDLILNLEDRGAKYQSKYAFTDYIY